jgi:Zn-dependent protease
VLYALGDPLSLVLLLASFLVAVTVVGWTSSLVAARQGQREVVAERRTRPDPRRHVDPFGAIAVAIAGIGWARPVEPSHRMSTSRQSKGSLVAQQLSGPLVAIVVGLVSLALLPLLDAAVLGLGSASRVLQTGVDGDLGARALLLFGLAHLMTGLLALVPLPPLPGGRLLFALAPRTPGWQKAEYQLVERSIGVAVLLALVLIPLGGPQALLPTLLDTVAEPLVRLVAGG